MQQFQGELKFSHMIFVFSCEMLKHVKVSDLKFNLVHCSTSSIGGQ